MDQSHGGGDPVVVVDSSKNQVIYNRSGASNTAGATGGTPHLQLPTSPDGENHSRGDGEVIEIIVYTPDKTGIQIKVRDGQNIEAGELFEVVMKVMVDEAGEALPEDETREAFSLWLVSDLLELQLKPNHVPFKLVCYWEELLEKYTTAPEEHQQRDEPVIMFRRNVFYSREAEKNINHTTLLRYLYWEAKKNILDGRYPLSQKECDELAGIQALITNKLESDNSELDTSAFGSAAYFKSRLAEYLPQHFCRRHWIYKTRENPERRLAEAYAQAVSKHSSDNLYKVYLSHLQGLPYYGSAFFHGQAEHPVKGIVSKVLSTKDDPVYVAINVDGVFIIDMDDVALLIGFYYENLSWQFVESENKENNANCLPCLFLQFPFEENSRDTKLLQIFSREAILMDNIIEACVALKRTTGSKKSSDESQVIYGKGNLAETFRRLALMTFSAEGKRIHSTVRHPKPVHASAESANV